MSRSYRAPWVKDKATRGMKRFANKAWRTKKDVPDGMAYKRYFNSYDLCDFRWRIEKPCPGSWQWRYMSYEQALKEYRKITRK